MSTTSLALDASRVDYVGDFSSLAIARCEDIDSSDCFQPLWMMVPGQGQAVTPSSGYIQYNFRIEPGSRIVGLWEAASNGLWQLRDVCMDHKLIQDSGNGMLGLGAPQGENVSFMMLPAPWRVMGSGLFSFEAWNTPGAITFLLLLIAEVKPC
jgi:hypothetical protein